MKVKGAYSIIYVLLALVCAFGLSAGLSRLALAQNITGTILGTVTDPTGASIPETQVTITNQATNQSHQVTTSKTGSYQVPYLPPGQYQVSASHVGFKTIIRKDIILEVDRRLVLDLKLELGSTATQVTVVGQTPLLNTTSAALGQVVSSQTTQALPLLGRNIFDLAGLTAGVQVNPKAIGGVASAGTVTGTVQTPLFVSSDISINGGRYRTNDFLVDGISVMVPANNNFAIAPTPANTAEFQVLTNSFGPQYGRSGGGVISVVTKSGTNKWHGEAYDFLRNQRMDANNYFSDAHGKSKGPFTFDLFGGYAGGPIIKDNTFIFGGFEGSRSHGLASGLSDTVPTALQRNGDFSQTFDSKGDPVTIYDPYSTRPNGSGGFIRDAFTNNTIPTSMMDPVALKLMSYVPLPNQPGVGPQQANNFGWAQTGFGNSDQWSVRLDHRFSERQTLFGRVTRNTGALGNSGPFNNIADNVLGNDTSHVINVVLNDTYTLSPTNFLNLRYGLTRLFEGRAPIHGTTPLTSFGFPSYMDVAEEQAFPAIGLTGYSSWGDPGGDAIRRGNTVNTFVAEDTWIRGRHTLVFGTDDRLYNQTPYQSGSPNGSYSFNSGFTQGPNPFVSSLTSGNALASFLLGYGGGSISTSPRLNIQNWYYSGYLNDEMKLGKLTLNVGMRYSYTQPQKEKYNRFANFDFNAPFPITVPGMPGLVGVLTHAGQNGVPQGQTNAYYKSFAPRFGLAYQVSSRLVLRAGYAIFFAPRFATTSGPGFGTAPYALTTSWVSSTDGITPLNPLSDPFPTGLLQPPTSQADLLQLGQGVSIMDRNNVSNQYNQQWNLGLQWRLPGSWLIETAYAGNKGTHLPIGINFNQLLPTYQSLGTALSTQVANPFYGLVSTGSLSTPTISQSQLLRPYPQYTSVSTLNPALEQNEANSSYNSLQVRAEHQFTAGFSTIVSWTWSKLMDQSSGRIFGINAYVPPVQNIYDLAAERSLSEGNVPQRLVITHVVDLPFGRGKRFLGGVSGPVNEIVGGWTLSGMASFNSGYPLVLTSIGNSGVGSSVLRPNSTGQSAVLSGSIESRLNSYFNTSAFTVPAPFTFGNTSRTLPDVRGPGRADYDCSLQKMIPIKETVNLLFRAEAFNLTNTPYFGMPGTGLGSSSFGVISSSSGERQIQLALKLTF